MATCSPTPYKKRRGKGGTKLLARGWRYPKRGGAPIRSKDCR